MEQPLLVNAFYTDSNVPCDRVREDEPVLHHAARMGTPYMRIDLLQRQVAYPDCPFIGLIKSQ